MKIAHLTNYYLQPVEKLYAGNPGLREMDFHSQSRAIFDLRFGWSDAWRDALEPMGHEVLELVGNARDAQRAWWRENVSQQEPGSCYDIIFEQIRRFDPDVVLLDDCANFPESFCGAVRAAIPGIGPLVGWCGSPFESWNSFGCYDALLSNIPSLVEKFRSLGLHAFFIPHAFDPRNLALGNDVRREKPLTFCGSLHPERQNHSGRIALLGEARRNFPIEIYSDIPPSARKQTGWHKLIFPGRAETNRRRAKSLDPLPAVYGADMYRLMAASRVTLNIHIDISAGEASNMRLFEATGMGACLLTDGKSGLESFFGPDEVVQFDSRESFLEKIHWFLEHPGDAVSVGNAGRRRTLKDHTFSRRAPLLLEAFDKVPGIARRKSHVSQSSI